MGKMGNQIFKLQVQWWKGFRESTYHKGNIRLYKKKDIKIKSELCDWQTRVPLQQQQLLYNGREMRNAENLSALGVADGDLVMMVSNAMSSSSSAANKLGFNPDGSAVNPSAFQQHLRNDSDMMAQLFQNDPELAQIILGNDLNHLQDLLRLRHNQRAELEMMMIENIRLKHQHESMTLELSERR